MRKPLFLLCLVLVALLLPLHAHASGYAVYEWSARGTALGGAMVARDADPSSVAYNPANITDLPGAQVQVGATAIKPAATMDFKSASQTDRDFSDAIWGLPTAYYTQQLNDHYWFGFGVFSRVGLGTEYAGGDNWAGRYNCSYAGIQSLTFNPNLAMKFSDQFSMAVGVEATYLRFMYDSTVPLADVKQEIDADGWAYGLNAGARYKPYDWLAFGLAWRSQIDLKVTGDVDFTRKKVTSPPTISQGGISGTEPLPESVTFGVMVKPIDRLSLEADVVWTRWSAYEALTMDYDPALLGMYPTVSKEKDWKNTWRFQFGAEYALTDSVDLRAGYVYDQSPINDKYEDFAVPCSDRQIVSVGAGWKVDQNWVVDVFYGYLWMVDRHYDARPVNYINYEVEREDAHAHMAGLSVTYKF
ncbi:OmpP1/FadL family transporter [Nitratidesulfovibrio sp. SRB-5]|uniref:OmpP1/FadL family transporter n=1 Tax=Nitratidesulfovibrio sp. SRB-5 TaxID=2872636 RepID=UPI0010273A1C|nr:OmpP1/FadL family transporter [Nitratidesulfovibrio sp. SRB-5]MBZ2170890.1 OmpP1/FadL family transporter [Nitratidesulfovibrio sp. SRB-5]RXF78113.1 transporter [Desulfovibrio sp. DS-1]